MLSVANDARQVKVGSVFIAIRGAKADGHDFIADAVKAGAVALVVENVEKVSKDFSGFVQVVKSSREALDILASRFFENPSQSLVCFGVTGTNGKTSITYMLEQILNAQNKACGVLGTVNHHLGDKVWPTSMTTPDPIDLQSRLHEMKQAGAKTIAMEVSSHALDQHRADAVEFDSVIFSNLTRDHLDYHPDMQNYFESKQRLFTDLLWSSKKLVRAAIVNIDDPWGARLRISSDAEVWTFGKNKKADFQFQISSFDFTQTEFILATWWGSFPCSLPLVGEYNVANAVAAIAAAASQDINPAASIQALANFKGVPGRMQNVPNNHGKVVMIDYAHSPDALENVLKTLAAIRQTKKSNSKIITVFGCGGDRDRGKRPLMGKIASQYSDQVVVTSDNPRTENPKVIIDEILTGISGTSVTEADRKLAIQKAIEMASSGDVVLIAGKGHEDYQMIGTEKHHFSDFEIAKEFLR